MKRLIEILNYLKDRDINISSLFYDDATSSALIYLSFTSDEDKLIEISDSKFCFFNEQRTEFNNYKIEQIIDFLNKNL